jgi:2-succinyl-5-enolpyruvyl-6-hydroxy-3-cyclohexene-1-carboxylate synthase
VHLNLAFRDPLVPEGTGDLGGRADGAPWTTRVTAAHTPVVDDLPDRTVLVLGDADGASTAAALKLAGLRGWPVVAEPSSGAAGANVVAAAELVLGVEGWLEAHRPSRVLVVGRPTLSRAVGRLVASAPSDVVALTGVWSVSASRVLPGIPSAAGRVDSSWLSPWLAAGAAAAAAVSASLTGLSEPAVAAAVMVAAEALVVVGSSKPVRDLFLAGGKPGTRVLANRGAAGIDGMVSTAVGAALAHGRHTFALMGDLTFLHDSNGLVIGPDEPHPDLTIVVVNNDGGAIFGLLEQGAPEHAAAFERVFGTPHGVDLEALCAAAATRYALVRTVEELRKALAETGGVRVVEVRTDRHEAVDIDRDLRAAVARVLA